MHLKFANNMVQPLAAAKAGGVNYLTITAPVASQPFYQAFSWSLSEGDYLVPITVINGDGDVIANGYVTHWDFDWEEDEPSQHLIYVDSDLASETIPSGCSIASRLRDEHINPGKSAFRSYHYCAAGSANAALPAACEHHYVKTDFATSATCTISLSTAAIPEDYSLPMQGSSTVARRHVVIVHNVGATQPTLTIQLGAYSNEHWKDGSTPAFSSGYNRLRITIDLAETGNWIGTDHWIASWEKFAD